MARIFLARASSLAALALPVLAQSQKIVAAPPPLPGGGDVREVLVSPDGTRVVYRADGTSHGVVELYSAPADGSAAPVRLNGPLSDYGVVADGFAISPNGTRVVYRASADVNTKTELYSAPIGGGGAVKLNGPMNGEDVASFELTADGTRVVYAADQDTWHKFELYVAPIDGSASSARLNGPLPGLSGVSGFGVAATGRAAYVALGQLFGVPLDGSAAPLQLTSLPASKAVQELLVTADGRAVFVQRQTSPSVEYRLWIAALDGSAAPLELTAAGSATLSALRLDPTETRAVYAASAAPGVHEVFSVPLDGSSAPVRLHPALAAGRSVVLGSLAVTADGARALWLSDQASDEVVELWSAPIDGSSAAQELSGALVAGGDVSGVHGAERVAANERVVYVADQDTDGLLELYGVAADGSLAAAKLSGTLVASSVRPYTGAAAPFGDDPTRAVFALDTLVGSETITELYGVPVDGSAAPVKLNSTPVAGGDVSPTCAWAFGPGDLYYVADQDTDDVEELFAVPLAGGASVKLNGPMPPTPPDFRVFDFAVTSDSARVVCVKYGDELLSVPADGSAPPVSLSGPIGFESGGSLVLAPDGTRCVYTDVDVPGNVRALYGAPADGSAAPLLLFSWHLGAGGFLGGVQITPDSAFAVFRANEQVWRAALNGSSAPLALTSAPASLAQTILAFRIGPAGDRVVFLQDRDVAGRHELYSVPLDGGSGPTKLNGTLVANGDVGGDFGSSFEIGPDGARVVYAADQDTDTRVELYVVPIAGGTPVKLNGALVSGGEVRTFGIAPDGSRVAYVADQEVDERDELYSVPLSGGGATKLNGALVAGGDVYAWFDTKGFAFSPDSARVVYYADQDVDQRHDVYSVLAAGGSRVKLSGSLPAFPSGGAIRFSTVRFSPDGRRVAFQADDLVASEYELFCRRVDGSRPLMRLNAPLPPGGAVSEFAFTPDGRVVYQAEQEAAGTSELYLVSAHGGTRRRLNGPLVERGDVGRFAISPDGARVVYSANEDTEQVYEVYESSLALPAAPAAPTKAGTKPTGTVTVVR